MKPIKEVNVENHPKHKGWFERIASGLVRFFIWVWNHFLIFLEVIGLRQGKSEDQKTLLPRLQLCHREFRRLLSSNDRFLECVNDLEEKLLGQALLDRRYLQRKVVEASMSIYHMMTSLNIISGQHYINIRPVFDRITRELQQIIDESEISIESSDLVLDLSHLNSSRVEETGGKMANLGELHNRLNLPTPDGFVVTVAGYHLLVDEGITQDTIHLELTTLFSMEEIDRVSSTLRERILAAGVPPALQTEILAAYDRLETRLGYAPFVAVRSSAVDEDSSRSFAGQFLSLLGVTRDGLLDAYLQVVASLHCPEAIHYRLLNGITGESAAMAVGIIAMVDATSSGIVFSQDPSRPESNRIVIQAVQGLGISLAEGRYSPEEIMISRLLSPASIERTHSLQPSRILLAEGAGIREEMISSDAAAKPCLTNDEALFLARWAMDLEEHFGSPQDIEWAMDKDRKIVLLQSRPLFLSIQSAQESEPFPGSSLLLKGGEPAFPGIASGLAFHLDEQSDFDQFPEGAILIAPRSSPRFVRLMGKARAIVTDAGSTTGHMACLAREFRVPALLNTHTATKDIPKGMMITVDSRSRYVYEGDVPLLIHEERMSHAKNASSKYLHSPTFTLLEKLTHRIIPLNLIDPLSQDFSPRHANTLHDLARFIHEKSYEEMFRLGERLGDARSWSYCLDIFLPIDLYLIDLGGGLEVPKNTRNQKVRLDNVTSIPLAALLKGMMHEKIPRYGPRPIDMQGLFSIMMRHAVTSPEQERTFRDPCYAMISDHYLNYTARVGYHFGVVDSYCGRTANKNYINIHFRGGAADLVRRSRRVRAIADILRAIGLFAEVHKDEVNARIGKTSQEETSRYLELIGRLLQFVRQMDVAMVSEEAVGHVRDAFLRGDYGLIEMKP